jgi:MoxR-like ATPase
MDPSRLTRIVVSWEGRLKQDQESRSQARDCEGNLLFKEQDGTPTTDRTGIRQAKRGNEPLFLAPPNAADRYGRRQTLNDRTNGGKGFTESELNETHVYEQSYGGQQFFHWNESAAYLANKANWLTEESDLVPLMEPTRHKSTYVDLCLQETRVLRQQVEEYGQKLDAHIASLHTDIRDHLWVTDDFIEPAAQSLEGTRRAVRILLDRIDKIRQGFEMLPQEVHSGHEA